MDAGVGASGPVDSPHDPVTEAGQRVFQGPLDGPLPGVHLEPCEVRPVVFDRRAVTLRRAVSDAFYLVGAMPADALVRPSAPSLTHRRGRSHSGSVPALPRLGQPPIRSSVFG